MTSRSFIQSAIWALAFVHGVYAAGQLAEQDVAEYNAMGVEAHGAGDWPAAVKAFERAYELDPDNKTIQHNLANTYVSYANEYAENGNIATAIDYVMRAIEIDPDGATPFVQLGAYYLHQGLISDAIFRLEEAIELEPENVDAHFLLGEAYYKDNDVSAALDQWEWVYEVDRDREGLADRLEMALRDEKVEFDFKGQASRNFSLTYTRDLSKREAQDILRILESAYREIGRALGSHAYPPTPIHVTLYSAQGFTETTQLGENVGAVYDGTKIRCPVFDEHGALLPEDELKRRLYHEYVHVVVRHIAKDMVPWWFNEGLAEALSREISGAELALLRDARDNEALFELRELSEQQLRRLDPAQLDLAYRQSHVAVTVIKERYGTRRLGAILLAIGRGEDPEAAIRQIARYSYKTLQLAVADYAAKR